MEGRPSRSEDRAMVANEPAAWPRARGLTAWSEQLQRLRASGLMELLQGRDAARPLRAWLVGCATGEEAYALAIALFELQGDAPRPMRIFATDRCADFVARARLGWFSSAAMEALDPEIRDRYFARFDGGFRVGSALRASVLFASHEIARDAPYARNDLVICHERLYQLPTRTKSRALAKLHYALVPGGLLFLSKDALNPGLSTLFTPVDWKSQIFVRSPVQPRFEVVRESGRPRAEVVTGDSVEQLQPPRIDVFVPRSPESTEDLVRECEELRAVQRELLAINAVLWRRSEELISVQDELRGTYARLTGARAQLHTREQGLERLGADLDNVLESVGIPLVILDADRRIHRYTPEATRILNVLERDVGRAFADLRGNLAVDDLDARIRKVIGCMQTQELEVQDLRGCWYRMRVRPYRTVAGEIEVAVSLIDIDDLKGLVQQAELAHQEADLANRTKDQFLATLSHELRSPLHGILVNAHLLQRGSPSAERLERATREITSGIHGMTQLIDDLLDVSRIVNGKLTLQRQTIDLAALTERALAAVSTSLADKKLRVEAALPDTLPVHGDAMRMQQVVGNLLSNAIKFTPAGGTITISLSVEGERAVLCVRDDGIGIEASFLPRVFDRFTQADATLARDFGGLGLGLAIVRHLVELHGGVVCAESDGPGSGARFTVSIPRSVVLEQMAPRPATKSGMVPKGTLLPATRILVVDDDRAARYAIGELLEQAGAQVWTVPSAADAIEALADFVPELMLCDIAMPGEDGLSLMRRVRARGGAMSQVPALALTALARPEDRERVLAAGYQAHLTKPVDIDTLLLALAALITPEDPDAADGQSVDTRSARA